ncbi:alanine racemase [Ignatzschineria rhizosphaerae]|uniref:Alanine racemase n=1 Tax=Ignatzschineria rhizosphaerae TaxID=2923279 RepID=A0ABY3X106_9GAMM|nr:alanine racemase [Ignatzschineria rhizosphaerae]UNM95451.1 alanine racemase [Ignatzschineria rhizosphaerae]
MRPLIAYFSEAALENNLAILKGKAPNSQCCAVIKANAYGHRVENLIPILNRQVDYMAVAIREEADDIRQKGGELPILLLEGVFSANEYQIASEQNYYVAIGNNRQLEMLQSIDLESPLNIFLKVDTGMHRLGFTPEEAPSIVTQLKALSSVASITLMTHFATSDEKDSPLLKRQVERMSALDRLQLPQTLANSAALLTLPMTHHDIVRMGISLYGISPIDDSTGKYFGLKPLLTLTSKIIHTTMIDEGESVGYGAKFIAPERMPIGVIACGYADGYPREITKEAYVLVGKYRAPIIGRPAMDMMMIDLRDVPQTAWNELVEIFGEQLPLEKVAAWAGTIPYTILTHIAPRVHFLKR